MDELVLTLSCPDKIGIVAAVTDFIAKHQGNILRSHQHGEFSTHTFFMRVAIDANTIKLDEGSFKKNLEDLAKQFNMNWTLHHSAQKKVLLF